MKRTKTPYKPVMSALDWQFAAIAHMLYQVHRLSGGLTNEMRARDQDGMDHVVSFGKMLEKVGRNRLRHFAPGACDGNGHTTRFDLQIRARGPVNTARRGGQTRGILRH